jgi:peptide/nickel transport system substrate-binding protein
MSPRTEKIMEKLGYGPDRHLAIQVSTRNISYYRDPAVILIDQLRQIYIDGDLDTVDTTNWYPKVIAKGLYRRSQDRRERPR